MALPLWKLRASWALQLAAAGILAQTLFFKFTAATESVYIFTKLGMEPWGRIGSGLVELMAVILLLTPGAAGLGALIAAAVMTGAILGHLTRLGIVVKDDGGLLFMLAVVCWAASAAVAYVRRSEVLSLGTRVSRAIRCFL